MISHSFLYMRRSYELIRFLGLGCCYLSMHLMATALSYSMYIAFLTSANAPLNISRLLLAQCFLEDVVLVDVHC